MSFISEILNKYESLTSNSSYLRSDLYKYVEQLTKKYVPENGEAKTLGGEILRALNYVTYRYYNDGIDPSVWIEDDSSRELYPEFIFLVSYVYGVRDYNSMELFRSLTVATLAENTVKYLNKNPKVFEIKNSVDCHELKSFNTPQLRFIAREYLDYLRDNHAQGYIIYLPEEEDW